MRHRLAECYFLDFFIHAVCYSKINHDTSNLVIRIDVWKLMCFNVFLLFVRKVLATEDGGKLRYVFCIFPGNIFPKKTIYSILSISGAPDKWDRYSMSRGLPYQISLKKLRLSGTPDKWDFR